MHNDSKNRWLEDLDQLSIELPERHKNLFFKYKKSSFIHAINQLKLNIGQYDKLTIIMNIAKIVASIGDAHTAIALPLFTNLPFKCYWFDDGIYITSALPDYHNILHCKIQSINGIQIENVIQSFSTIIPHENIALVKSQLPKHLISAEALYGLGIIDQTDQIKVSLEKSKETFEVSLPALRENHYKVEDDEGKFPLYRQHQNKYYWKTLMPDQSLLYFNYNKCKDREDIAVNDFYEELKKEIIDQNLNSIVIDIRNNGGGNSTLLEPFIQWLGRYSKAGKAIKVYAVIGRDTFSSALLNAYSLKNKTNATLIGEATGGKPNCFGEVQYFKLKNSGLLVRYSTEYYRVIKDDKLLSLFPDIECPVAFQDFIQNRDPCLEYVINNLQSI